MFPPAPPRPAPAQVTLPSQNERWDNMQHLFSHIRQNAAAYEYPNASVAALETVLIRLFLESPVAGAAGMDMELGAGIQGGSGGGGGDESGDADGE